MKDLDSFICIYMCIIARLWYIQCIGNGVKTFIHITTYSPLEKPEIYPHAVLLSPRYTIQLQKCAHSVLNGENVGYGTGPLRDLWYCSIGKSRYPNIWTELRIAMMSTTPRTGSQIGLLLPPLLSEFNKSMEMASLTVPALRSLNPPGLLWSA